MKAVFEEEQRREFNKLNENSVKFRNSDIDEIDNMQLIEFFDDNNNQISDAEIYLPPNKAYIVMNRVHFGEAGKVFLQDKKDVLKKMINYFFYPSNLKYLASAIYINIHGVGISENMANEVGFYPSDGVGISNIFRVLNKDFEQFLEYTPADEEIKNRVLQNYGELKDKDRAYLNGVRERLKISREVLSSEDNEDLIEAKKVDIKHYEAILGIEQGNKERAL